MRILFLCHRIPYPPKRGGKIRPFNMIKHLGKDHEVTVATIARSAAELADGEGLREHCHALHVGQLPGPVAWARFGLHALTSYPATFAYFYSRTLAQTITRLLRSPGFDAIVVHSSSMGPYVAHHRDSLKVMDFGDADSEKWFEYARTGVFPLSTAFALEGRKVRRWERRLGEDFDVCTVNVPRERDVLAAYVRKPIHVITNGVDLEYFHSRVSPDRYSPDRLIFTGNMSYRPNVDAVRHFVASILPRVRQHVQGAELYIVGMDPTPAVRRLANRAGVIVTGRVDDVRPYFEDAAVAIAPLRVARGLQNKVLEAMAMRVPVVASPAAYQGLDAVAGRDLLVAEDPEAFANAIVALLRDPSARERYAAAGRACVERNHDWERSLRRLDALLLHDAPRRANPAPVR